MHAWFDVLTCLWNVRLRLVKPMKASDYYKENSPQLSMNFHAHAANHLTLSRATIFVFGRVASPVKTVCRLLRCVSCYPKLKRELQGKFKSRRQLMQDRRHIHYRTLEKQRLRF
jgi:hypothetical protein